MLALAGLAPPLPDRVGALQDDQHHAEHVAYLLPRQTQHAGQDDHAQRRESLRNLMRDMAQQRMIHVHPPTARQLCLVVGALVPALPAGGGTDGFTGTALAAARFLYTTKATTAMTTTTTIPAIMSLPRS